MDRDSSPIRNQYERFPYPPIPWMALPARGEGEELRFERGTLLAEGKPRSHRGIRILVAGAGTFEPAIIAQAHPQAREIVAVELSDRSLSRLSTRLRFLKLARLPSRLPSLRLVCADLRYWEPENLREGEGFDYILASNVLHHIEAPDLLLARLAGWLNSGGLLRLVTYPKASRIFMRETGKWLRLQGIGPDTPQLLRQTRLAMNVLPQAHPVSSCFRSHPEVRTSTGLVDAFLNACEVPLSPLEWERAAQKASLRLIAEDQRESSRSSFLSELLPKTAKLSAWQRLQILDDLLELCANPVLWLRKENPVREEPIERLASPPPSPKKWQPKIEAGVEFSLPSRLYAKLGAGLRRAQNELASCGISLEETIETLKREVGPRVAPPPSREALPGLSILEYPLCALLEAREPWSMAQWQELEKNLGPSARLESLEPGLGLPTKGALSAQAEYAQIVWGATHPTIRLRIR